MFSDKIYEKAVKSINDLFAPFEEPEPIPYIILIEGAPGIGKTILSKEISLQWVNNTLLHSKQLLFLLYMRDPRVKCIQDVHSLVRYFCHSENSAKIITDWLIETSGEHLAIILDGYDEISEDHKSQFIHNDIIGRNELVKCALVITSRPAASAHLHSRVNCRAEVLGFTEEDRLDYISNALPGATNKIEQLRDFLQSNPSLNTLCYIPLNMSILLCLAEEGVDKLPNTQTSLYQKFVTITIVHFLKKDKRLSSASIGGIENLPPPHAQVVKELAQFAFLALQRDQLVFTSEEIKAECPKLTPANWYGYGLLKPAQYFKPQDGCEHDSFHFLHYSIQEYLAAYHITSLSYSALSDLLQGTFWDIRFINTWIMYVGMTHGKQFAFRHFLTGNHFAVSTFLFKSSSISDKIRYNQLKCLHLLHCLAECEHDLLSAVQNVFQDGTIDLSCETLSPKDVHILMALLLRSPNKQWTCLNLSNCDLDMKSCHTFQNMYNFHKAELNIKIVDISRNCSLRWEAIKLLCELLKFWNTEKLVLSTESLLHHTAADAVGDFKRKLVYGIHLHPRNCIALHLMYMADHNRVIAVLVSSWYNIKCTEFTECKLNDELIKELRAFLNFVKPDYIECSYITNENAGEIISELSSTFKEITLVGSFCYSKSILKLVDTKIPVTLIRRPRVQSYIKVADFLAAILCQNVNSEVHDSDKHIVDVPTNSQNPFVDDATEIATWLHYLNGFIIASGSISNDVADEIATVLLHASLLKEFSLNKINLQTKCAISKIINSLQDNSYLTILNMEGNDIEEAADDIAIVLSHNTNLQVLNLNQCSLHKEGVIKIARALQSTSSLVQFGMKGNNIGDKTADEIAIVLFHNKYLQCLNLDETNLQTIGTIKIAKSLQNNMSLLTLTMAGNGISDEAADDLATILSLNSNLQSLDLSRNNLQSEGAKKIAQASQKMSSLILFNMGSNNIGDEAAGYIASVLSNNIKLQYLYLYDNNLLTKGIVKISRSLQHHSSLKELSMEGNSITDEATDDIANILSRNTKLLELDLSNNILNRGGLMKIANSLQNTSSLVEFNIGDNNVGDETADCIASVLSHNTKLQRLHLYNINLQTEGAIKIAKSLQNNSSLRVFNMRDNNIGDEAADDIADVLSHSTKLETLSLGQANLQTDGVMKIIKGLQSTVSLKTLNLGGNNIGVEAVDDLTTVLGNAKLQHLYLRDNNVGDETADCIASVLSHNTELQHLYLYNINLQTEGAIKIAKSLQNNSSLRVFNMRDNNIGDEAADDIADVLSHSTKLETLSLGQANLQTDGVMKIIKGLQNTVSLKTLNLGGNNIGVEAIDDLTTILGNNTKLQHLYLNNANLLTDGVIRITKNLQNISSLKTLEMEGNDVSDKAADDIATCLSQNNKLQNLNLSCNKFQKEGMIKIVNALQNTSSLVEFNIGDNNIDDETADCIASVLSHNTELQHL